MMAGVSDTPGFLTDLGPPKWQVYQIHELHHRLGHVKSMYRSSPFRSTLNTSYITGVDICKLFTEAVHSVAL